MDIKTENKMDIKTEIKMEADDSISDESKINSLNDLGPYIATKDNLNSFQYFSTIPKICFEKPCILGVDEAGRGPVLGKRSIKSLLSDSNSSNVPINSLYSRSHGVRHCLLR